jgi:hypothetical protein
MPSKYSQTVVTTFMLIALVIIGLMAVNKIINTYVAVRATKEEQMARRVWKWKMAPLKDSTELCNWLDSMKGDMDYPSFKLIVMKDGHFWVLYRGTR